MTKRFEESDRYDIPGLTADGIVIDGGGYEGNFAIILARKYGCRIYVYEPVREFYGNIAARLISERLSGNVTVHNVGLGAKSREVQFGVKGDQSGLECAGNHSEKVQIVALHELIDVIAPHGRSVDLLKLNIEGMEFEVLESLVDRGLTHRFNHIHCQFHPIVPDYAQRHETIRNGIAATHDLVFDEPFCWSGWKLK